MVNMCNNTKVAKPLKWDSRDARLELGGLPSGIANASSSSWRKVIRSESGEGGGNRARACSRLSWGMESRGGKSSGDTTDAAPLIRYRGQTAAHGAARARRPHTLSHRSERLHKGLLSMLWRIQHGVALELDSSRVEWFERTKWPVLVNLGSRPQAITKNIRRPLS